MKPASPNSPSCSGGSAASAAGDRECNANVAIAGPDLTHSLVSRGGTATSAIDGVRSEPLHSSSGVQDQAFPTDSKEREKQMGCCRQEQRSGKDREEETKDH